MSVRAAVLMLSVRPARKLVIDACSVAARENLSLLSPVSALSRTRIASASPVPTFFTVKVASPVALVIVMSSVVSTVVKSAAAGTVAPIVPLNTPALILVPVSAVVPSRRLSSAVQLELSSAPHVLMSPPTVGRLKA